MNFKERYTTSEIKTKILAKEETSKEEKDKEETKTIISNESFLFADLLENLTNELNLLRRIK